MQSDRRLEKFLLFLLRYGMHRVADKMVPFTQAEIDDYARRLGITYHPFGDDLAACAETNS